MAGNALRYRCPAASLTSSGIFNASVVTDRSWCRSAVVRHAAYVVVRCSRMSQVKPANFLYGGARKGFLDLRGTNSDLRPEGSATATIVPCQDVHPPRSKERRAAPPKQLTTPRYGRRACLVLQLCSPPYEWSIPGDEDCRRLCQGHAERFLSRLD